MKVLLPTFKTGGHLMKLTRKALPILLTLHKFNTYWKKLYCYPSQKKLLTLLSQFTSLKISRRQLNYDLHHLERCGVIVRVRRHRRTKHRGMEFRSTLYEITLAGYNLLLRAHVISVMAFKKIRAVIMQALEKKERPCAETERKSTLTSLSDILRGLETAFD